VSLSSICETRNSVIRRTRDTIDVTTIARMNSAAICRPSGCSMIVTPVV